MREMLAPVVALVIWTFVMWAWMYATRLPAMARMKMRSDPRAPRGQQMSELPAEARWKADNYNHLMEMPTLFYAIALVLAIDGQATAFDVQLAWSYVGLRVVHSLVQALGNKVEVRFVVFTLSSITLITLVIRAALRVFV